MSSSSATASTHGSQRRATCFADFRDAQLGDTIVVCGCGESLNLLDRPERFVTIGVNDIGRRFHPDYLVVVNPRSQFKADRFRYVETSQARYLFTQFDDLRVPHPQLVRIRLDKYGGTDFSNPDALHYTQNSPYVALCLAVHMGAKRIGLIGVDFTENHFFGKTGRHPLAARLEQIDREYGNLAQACRGAGIEVFNLSPVSRLTAFPKADIAEFLASPTDVSSAPVVPVVASKQRRVFVVNYRFLSCGDVFADGLRHAAAELGHSYQEALWDDRHLPTKVDAFGPELIFVVHGRRFAQKWGDRFRAYNTAVWLVDEPYEVDDTAKWSHHFKTVFVNDPNTLHRHRNAHYLPVCYDPHVHREAGRERTYKVGFIGGFNATRERYLLSLADAGLLGYVVGGPWKAPALRKLSLAQNIPSQRTAELYRQTEIVVNVFREVHHYNRQNVPAFSMNPRVYEALACGAVVVSEHRDEVAEVFPEIPRFSEARQLTETISELLANEQKYGFVKRACMMRLRSHTYRHRLLLVLRTLDVQESQTQAGKSTGKVIAMETITPVERCSKLSLDGWEDHGHVSEIREDGCIVIRKSHSDGPGTEQGLASTNAYQDVELAFEINLDPDACFVAKVHQIGQYDQATNSYHLFCHPERTYLAMHHRIFQDVRLPRGKWQSIKLKRAGDIVELAVEGAVVARIRNGTLARGYCFLGVKGGTALLRQVTLRNGAHPQQPQPRMAGETGAHSTAVPLPTYRILVGSVHHEEPVVSIVTTVYDRLECLRECVRSVRQLQYPHVEHIIVSDHPPDEVVHRVRRLVADEGGRRARYADLDLRFNNWGIAPASVGLHLTRGRYVCFLSDDNAYTPDHLNSLVSALDRDSHIGFAYSSCQYGGRRVLRNSTPRPGGIDLGQPLFRKELFNRYLPGALPFDMMAWDWHMVDAFVRQGVKWRHIDRATFLFRAAACRREARV